MFSEVEHTCNSCTIDQYILRTKAKHLVHEKLKILPELTVEDATKLFLELEIQHIELEMQNNELHKTQEEAEEVKERYFKLYNDAPVCYCTLDEDGFILEANERTTKTMGLGVEQLLRKKISDFVFSEDKDIYYLHKQKILESNEPQTCELRVLKSDGSSAWMSISATTSYDKKENRIYHLIFNNIDERKMMEERLRNKEKMLLVQSRYAAMGEMISMIAHQWRQPLNIIGLAIANMKTKKMFHILDEASIDENTDIITENIAFMSNTIDDFRNFFKPDALKELATMEEAITITLNVIGQSLVANNITISVHNNSKTSLLIHKSSLVQVLLNIIGNAKDEYISHKVEPAVIDITVNETEDKIALAVSDKAGGISNEIIEKINQPYFTTKKVNGTGLGLYISQTIIEKHFFGTLTWYNQHGGACFVITLNKKERMG
ncbi:MAG: PAS domain-containing sensor histidine kinase [Sulfurimonas sp.]|jgi:PAS domain S-box-containing protein